MKRLVFIVEGETEESFVNNVLTPYFRNKGIYNQVQCFKIKHSKGGMSKYSYIKQDVVNTLYESDVVVTTLIDFFRLPSDFPGYGKKDNLHTHQEQADFLEVEMKADVENTTKFKLDNFIPYIQLHEFETLIFSSKEGIESLFEVNKEYDKDLLEEVISEFPNPEDINSSPDKAPSKRLMKIIKGYNKATYGPMILEWIGVDVILQKCSRCRGWIERLENILRS